MDFTFHMPVRIISGEGCIRQSGRLLREFGKRCLIMTGMSSAKASGRWTMCWRPLRRPGLTPPYSPKSPPTLLSQCQTAYTAEICRAEFIIGIGGGSVMDAAKAAAWLATNNCNDGERLMEQPAPPSAPSCPCRHNGGDRQRGQRGFGADHGRGQTQAQRFSPNLYAKLAFADPRYTFSIPRRQTVSTALDAFAHAVEGGLPLLRRCNHGVRGKAFPLIADGLDWLVRHDGLPGPDMRTALYYGSLWAGMVLNATGTAYPHPRLYPDRGVRHTPRNGVCRIPARLPRPRRAAYAGARRTALRPLRRAGYCFWYP